MGDIPTSFSTDSQHYLPAPTSQMLSPLHVAWTGSPHARLDSWPLLISLRQEQSWLTSSTLHTRIVACYLVESSHVVEFDVSENRHVKPRKV